jgi:tetratricopeptide (TPR) repeat protein
MLPPALASASSRDVWLEVVRDADAACAERDYERAELLLLDALDDATSDADELRIGDTHHRLGLVYEQLGDLARAEAALLQAIGEPGDQHRTLSAGHGSRYIAYINSLAVLYERMGDLRSAEQHRLQVVEVAEATAMNVASIAIAKANLARFRARHGARQQALAGHADALELLETGADNDDQLVAEQLEAVAAIHKRDGDWAQAEDAYVGALQIWYRLGEPATFVFAKALAGYADLLWSLERRDEANDYLRSAVDMADELWGNEPPPAGAFEDAYVSFLSRLGESVAPGPRH